MEKFRPAATRRVTEEKGGLEYFQELNVIMFRAMEWWHRVHPVNFNSPRVLSFSLSRMRRGFYRVYEP